MRRRSNLKVTASTGNVFRDLGFSAEESDHLLVRADLLLRLQKALAARKLTQVQAARLVHVTQLRVLDLLRGRIDHAVCRRNTDGPKSCMDRRATGTTFPSRRRRSQAFGAGIGSRRSPVNAGGAAVAI